MMKMSSSSRKLEGDEEAVAVASAAVPVGGKIPASSSTIGAKTVRAVSYSIMRPHSPFNGITSLGTTCTRSLHVATHLNTVSANNNDDNQISTCNTVRVNTESRRFSSRARNGSRRGGNRGGGKNSRQQGQPIINEHLIRMLLQTSTETADSLQVRLIIDRPHDHDDDDVDGDDAGHDAGDDNKSDNEDNSDNHGTDQKEVQPEVEEKQAKKNKIQLVSLSQAISIATEIGVDLVGITLQQKIPVLRAIDYSKFLYEQSAKEKKRKKSIKKQTKANKEFTFRAGIDVHDLERKTKNLVSYLQKGHSCQVTITSNYRNLKNDQDIIATTLDRIQEYIGESGNAGKLKKNPYGNRGSILFQPTSKKQ